MASITKLPNGRRKIQAMIPTGRRDARGKPVKARRSIALGKIAQADAESVARHVDHLAGCLASGLPIRPATADWLADIGEELHARLVAAGLVGPPGGRPAGNAGGVFG